MSEMTKKEAAVWMVIKAILDAIKEAGEMGIPAGHLYAAVCGHMCLDNFEHILDILVRGNKITRSNNLLKAL